VLDGRGHFVEAHDLLAQLAVVLVHHAGSS
jgi:hypothetical protein